ncbi:MAG TPA: glycosyltransferase [Anaerolineae bacterium]|nr:glycosyltransferase [Anaerolineae bacterium]
MHKLRVLCVANKAFPDGDHRLACPQLSKVCSITYALPSKPDVLDENCYVRMGFSEGLHISIIYHFIALLVYLVRNRRRLDFVHYCSTNLILLGPLLSKLAGLPSIITVTGFGRTFSSHKLRFRLLRPLYMLLMGISMRCASRVLFQNRGDLEWLATRFPWASDKFRYVGSAVSMPVTRHKSFSASRLRVLLVARLLPDKGIEDFLQVADALHQKEFEFVLVGPASRGFDELAARVKDYHLRGVIDYKGELDPVATLEEFAQAHVFYFPSYGEGMARVMLEAGFARVCPIAYDIPANRDLVVDGGGFLLNSGSVKQVISILEDLAGDRKLLERNAIAYQDHIVEHYDIQTFSQRMDNILLELAGEIGIW